MDHPLTPEQQKILIEEALRTFPVASLPHDLTGEVLARIRTVPAPRPFRLTWSDVALGIALSKIMFEGPDDTLRLTENAQPALMASSMAVIRVLEAKGVTVAETASYVAGHSLGEYSALCAAGTFSLSDTARLLQIRGRAMQQAVPVGVMSLEMTANALVMRLIASHARVNLRDIMGGFLSDRDVPKLTAAAVKINKAPLIIDDAASMSIGQLRAKARRMFALVGAGTDTSAEPRWRSHGESVAAAARWRTAPRTYSATVSRAAAAAFTSAPAGGSRAAAIA